MDEPPRLGILMLDTRFPRVQGDVGNAASFDFPVRYRRVKSATPDAIVLRDSRMWVDAFIREGQALVAAGCTGLATTCGFLTLVREDVAKACGVPVASSALQQVPMIAASLPPGRTVGILTISKASLTDAHLSAAGIPTASLVVGVDGSSFARTILGNDTQLDIESARDELVSAARKMCSDNPAVAAIVLECTNMPPYAADIQAATGRPVFSMLTYLTWFHSGLRPAGRAIASRE